MRIFQVLINPDIRLGQPCAVAGLQPEDERRAKLWRRVAPYEVNYPRVENLAANMVTRFTRGQT